MPIFFKIFRLLKKGSHSEVDQLLNDIRSCSHCKQFLPFGPNPVIQASTKSKIVLIGQAPGKKVHESGIPWDDQSGKNLRDWLGVDKYRFYDPECFALIPMGFCYPGTGKSGDLPPRRECAPLWHSQLLAAMPHVQLTVLIGKYAQDYYLANAKDNLTETVKSFDQYTPKFFPIPHPSPRNAIWLAKNPWFKQEALPRLKNYIITSLK